MKNINLKLYFKDIILFVITVIFFIGLIIFTVMNAPDSNYFGYKVAALKNTLNISFYIFLLLLFISYKFLNKVNTYKLYEVQNISISSKKYKISQIVLLILIALIFTLIFITYNLFYNIKFRLTSIDYNIYVVLNCVLNIFLIGVLAISIGNFLAKIKNRLLCYALLIILAFIFSPVFQTIISEIKLYENIDFSFFSNLFNLFTAGLNFMPNFNNGYSILPYRWILIIFWIVFFSASDIFTAVKRDKAYIIKFSIKSLISVLLIILYLIPSSKILPDYSPAGSIQYDFYHYVDISDLEGRENYEQKDEPANFTVSKYNITLNISSKLNAKVIIDIATPSDSNLYKFTLYHSYSVDAVTDQNGNNLDFEQNNDYLTINTANTIDSLIISYSGSAAKYYSNYQGVCLPANFAYYPISGYHIVYDSENQSFNQLCFDNAIDIDLNIKAPYKVYCNLPEIDNNSFKGVSEGITLVSGFLIERTVNDITFVYSYLNDDFDKNINKIADELSGIWKSSANSKGYCIYNKKIFILPNLNQGQAVTFFSDHITTMSSLSEEYEYLLEGENYD